MDIERTKQIKFLLFRCIAFKENMIRTLNDSSTNPSGRYSAFKTYAEEYSRLAKEVSRSIEIDDIPIMVYDLEKMKGWADTLWPQQKEVIDSLVVYTDTLIALLERDIEFVEDEFVNLENFLKNRLRSSLFKRPEKEIEVQNAIESLFIGKGWSKGIDYDRETGKIVFLEGNIFRIL